MNVPNFFATAGPRSGQLELVYIWQQATPEGKAIIFCLLVVSIIAWSVMIFKAIQMRRAKKLNRFFTAEFRSQKAVLTYSTGAFRPRVVRCSWCIRPAASNWTRG